MLTVRLRRGTPCEVRPSGGRWRPHVCSHESVFRFDQREVYSATTHWVFSNEGWDVRVAVSMLERTDTDPDDWRVGLTGTREGLTAAQRAAVRTHLNLWLVFALGGVPTFHHGGSVGADRDLHAVVREVFGRVARIVIHPASDQPRHLRDWTDADEVRAPARSPERNREVVDSISLGALLITCPKARRPEPLSGTWSTARYAESKGRGALFFWPDGEVGN